MLTEKLAKADRDARRTRFVLLTGLGAVIGVVALFLLGIVKVDFELFQRAPEETQPAKVAAPTKLKAADAPEPLVIGQQREALKEKLTEFEGHLLAQIESPAFAIWNADAQHTVLREKEASIAAFATADYDKALAHLETATTLAEKELSARDVAFDAALADARRFADADDVDNARVVISAALRLKPDDPSTTALSEKIERLPKVLVLIERASVAEVENDLPGEAALLREALELDPERTALEARLKAVQEAIREARFSDLIDAGFNAVAIRNHKVAQNSLTAAEAMFVGRDELNLLGKAVANLALSLKVERLTADAEKAAAGDNWMRAQRLLGEALKLMPDSVNIRERLVRADNIVATSARIDGFLARPERLAAANVMAQAKTVIAGADQYLALSPSLQADVTTLGAKIDGYAKPVEVIVSSDGATRVSVRGVGQVGVLVRKTISLKPGRYTFEGVREGFKSVLVSVDIAPGQSGVSVKVVCHELI